MKKKVQIGFIGLLILISLIPVSYRLVYWNKIYPGIRVAGQPMGKKTISEATKILKSMTSSLPQHNIEMKSSQQQWQFDLDKIGFSYNATATAQKAFQIGRTGKPIKDLRDKITGWFKGININLNYSFSKNLLDNQIINISRQVFVPAIEPNIQVLKTFGKSSRVVIEPGKDGQTLDKQKLMTIINYQFSGLDFKPIELPLIYVSPTLTDEQVENTRLRAEKLLDKKLILVADEQTRWQLKEDDLIEFLSFNNGFDQEKIASWSANLALVVNRQPENAAFQFSEGRVTEFRPAKEGKTLEQEKTVDLIKQNLIELELGKNQVTAKLPIILTPPAIKTADVNTLGIKQLIGRGTSYFRGSIPSRVHNIQLASSKLNGLLMPPSETLSFNLVLGEISQATGYKEAYIIKEGRTVLGDGGGVCQVSTTFFRAALDAGLAIIERHAHAYRVGYYEQDSPVGFDATVFAPSVDLKVKNNTPAYILIQTSVDTKNNLLTFELYGTSDNRTVFLSKPRVWDQVPPPPDLYQDDPTLPAGAIKQIDWKAWGAKVTFDYRVERSGEILEKQTFYSGYRPWQAIFLRGTKTIQ